MQTVVRGAIIVLLIVIVVAIAGSQTQVYKQQPVLPWLKHSAAATPQAQTALAQSGNNQQAATTPVIPQPTSAVVTVASQQDVAREWEEKQKDRDIQRGIEISMARISATSLAQNYLMIFISVIFFVFLIVLYSLLETVKRFARAAEIAAEAARVSAQAATEAQEKSGGKVQVNKFIMRRACRQMRR